MRWKQKKTKTQFILNASWMCYILNEQFEVSVSLLSNWFSTKSNGHCMLNTVIYYICIMCYGVSIKKGSKYYIWNGNVILYIINIKTKWKRGDWKNLHSECGNNWNSMVKSGWQKKSTPQNWTDKFLMKTNVRNGRKKFQFEFCTKKERSKYELKSTRKWPKTTGSAVNQPVNMDVISNTNKFKYAIGFIISQYWMLGGKMYTKKL